MSCIDTVHIDIVKMNRVIPGNYYRFRAYSFLQLPSSCLYYVPRISISIINSQLKNTYDSYRCGTGHVAAPRRSLHATGTGSDIGADDRPPPIISPLQELAEFWCPTPPAAPGQAMAHGPALTMLHSVHWQFKLPVPVAVCGPTRTWRHRREPEPSASSHPPAAPRRACQ